MSISKLYCLHLIPLGIVVLIAVSRVPSILADELLPVYDITRHGARNNRDSTAALQRGLENFKHGKQVYVPAGYFKISKEVGSDYAFGGVIIGAGAGPAVKPHLPAAGAVSVLSGEKLLDDRAIVRFVGAHFRVSNLTFANAPIGAWITHPTDGRRGIGTGKFLMDNVEFDNCQIGIRVSQTGGHNADNGFFNFVIFRKCKTCFQVKNRQGVGYFFNGVFSYMSETIFDFWAGDNLHVQGLSISGNNTTVLSLKDLPSQNLGREFIIRDVLIDQPASSTCVLLDMPRRLGQYCDITFENVRLRGSDHLATIRGAAKLTLRNIHSMPMRRINFIQDISDRIPTLIVENSRLAADQAPDPADWFDLEASRGKCRLIVQKNISKGSLVKVHDWQGVVHADGTSTLEMLPRRSSQAEETTVKEGKG